MTSDAQSTYLDTPILRLIEESAVSVRLSNALHGANALPITTVRDYLDAGENAKLQFMRLQNLGRKSADELDELIHAFAREKRELPPSLESAADDADASVFASTSIRERLTTLFANDEYPAVFLDHGVSKRLETCLLHEPSAPLSEILSTWQNSCAAMLGRQNVGRRSIVELSKLALDHIRKRMRAARFSPEEIAAAGPIILMGSVPGPEIAAALSHRLNGVGTYQVATEEPPPNSLADTVIAALSLVDVREYDVLIRRYGHLDREIETLESISLTYNVTRERIRQIEAKALKKLSVRTVKRKIEAAFNAERALLPVRLHGGLGYLNDDNVYRAFQALPATDRIAIDILFKERSHLLKQMATHWHRGWIFEPLDAKELGSIVKELRQRAKEIALPNTVAVLAGDLFLDKIMPAMTLGTNLSTLEGYVTKKWFGPRLKRTIRLHQELFDAASTLEVRELIARYHRHFPADPCSVRDAIIVMCAAPHLFIELQDGVWASIGEAPPLSIEQTGEDSPAEAPPVNLDEPFDQTIRAGLRDILRRCGPLRFVDIRSEAVTTLGQKHIHSVGPILLTSGTFIRPLPGIYALPDQLPELSKIAFQPPAFLLNEEQAKFLAMARFAGEPFGSFSLWQPELEYALCRWGEANANPVVWQSLLATASIDAWPVSDREKEHWQDLKRRQGVYHLRAAIRYPIKQLWPPLHRLLAAMYLVRMRGSINWIVANRLLKRRIDAHASPALLGILCLLGIVTPSSHWQMPHAIKNLDDRLIDLLSAKLQRTGSLSWDSDIGTDVVDQLTGRATLPEDTWLNPALAAELRAVAADDPVDILSVPTESDDDAVSFESLLEEVARQQRLAAVQEDIRRVSETDNA